MKHFCAVVEIRLHKTLITKPCRNGQKDLKALAYIHGSVCGFFFFFNPFPNTDSLSLLSVVHLSQVEGLQGKEELLEMVQWHKIQ